MLGVSKIEEVPTDPALRPSSRENRDMVTTQTNNIT